MRCSLTRGNRTTAHVPPHPAPHGRHRSRWPPRLRCAAGASDTARLAPRRRHRDAISAARGSHAVVGHGRDGRGRCDARGDHDRRRCAAHGAGTARSCRRGSYGGATSLFIRGGESKYVKILVDGVPINDAGGAFDLSTLSTDNLDRIEIVRGPASVLYGSDAVAGVVQLFTRRGAGVAHGQVAARGGQFGSMDVDASVQGGGARAELLGRRRAPRERWLPALQQSLPPGRRQRPRRRRARRARREPLRAIHRSRAPLSHQWLGRRSSTATPCAATTGSPSASMPAIAPRRSSRFARRSRRTTCMASPTTSPTVPATTATPTRPPSARDAGVATCASSSRCPPTAGITLGAQVERKWQESVTRSNFGDDAPAPATRRSTGAYAQLLMSPVADATLALGGRLEHNEQFGDFLTYRAAASTRLRTGTRLRASVGTAFREPTFLETEGSGVRHRQPGARSGARAQRGRRHRADASVPRRSERRGSRTRFADMIDYEYSATEPNYFNLARTRAAGLELEGRLALPNGLHADAAFTHLRTRVVDPGTSPAATATFAPGSRLLRRPARTLDVGAGYRARGNALDLRVLRVGVREDVYYPPNFAPAQRVSLAPYTRVDLSGEARLVPLRRTGGVALTLARREPVRPPLYRRRGVQLRLRSHGRRRRSSRPAIAARPVASSPDCA